MCSYAYSFTTSESIILTALNFSSLFNCLFCSPSSLCNINCIEHHSTGKFCIFIFPTVSLMPTSKKGKTACEHNKSLRLMKLHISVVNIHKILTFFTVSIFHLFKFLTHNYSSFTIDEQPLISQKKRQSSDKEFLIILLCKVKINLYRWI